MMPHNGNMSQPQAPSVLLFLSNRGICFRRKSKNGENTRFIFYISMIYEIRNSTIGNRHQSADVCMYVYTQGVYILKALCVTVTCKLTIALNHNRSRHIAKLFGDRSGEVISFQSKFFQSDRPITHRLRYGSS